MKKVIIVLILIFMVFVYSCASNIGGGNKVTETTSVVWISSSRGIKIPAILVLPVGRTGVKYPAVIVAHGHGGNKSFDGGFDTIKAAFSAKRIAVLSLDFPGCGDSIEDFIKDNRVKNMLSDLTDCREYLATRDDINMNKIGLLGYSMGGRIAAILAGKNPDNFKSLAFWSPALSAGAEDMYNFMNVSSESALQVLYNIAHTDGQVTYTTIYGYDQTLGKGWFDDMYIINPIHYLYNYSGNILLVTAGKDEIIDPANVKKLVAGDKRAKSIRYFEVKEATHGYGIYDGNNNQTEQAANATANFFKTTF